MTTTYDWYMRQGDLLPSISGTLYDGEGEAVISEGAPDEAVFNMRRKADNVAVVERGTVTFDHTTGAWSYTWQAGDTDLAGLHHGEVELVYSGKPQSFPSHGNVTIWIEAQNG